MDVLEMLRMRNWHAAARDRDTWRHKLREFKAQLGLNIHGKRLLKIVILPSLLTIFEYELGLDQILADKFNANQLQYNGTIVMKM